MYSVNSDKCGDSPTHRPTQTPTHRPPMYSTHSDNTSYKLPFIYWIFGVCLLYLTLILPNQPSGLARAIYMEGTERSYARYPKWDACKNASLSFEFKTTQEEGLLMYVDDGGHYDFIELMHKAGQVRAVLNIVDGRDGNVRIKVGNSVNDGHWHSVKIQRNRMETTLIVDELPITRLSYGTDFYFGDPQNNSYVFFGGLPDWYQQQLNRLALPSSLYQNKYKGYIRNVLYNNCTCRSERAPFLDGSGVRNSPREACDRKNPCMGGCVCISTDSEPDCDCTHRTCVTGSGRVSSGYRLPMDTLYGKTLINPSGLDALAEGRPALQQYGIMNSSITLDGPRQYVQVAGPGHRDECLGDLDRCTTGYTMSYWINFDEPADGETVYLSNGGHTTRCHGVAMTYQTGRGVKFTFRKKDGREWHVNYKDVLPKRWYHMAVSWTLEGGLVLYINGNPVDTDSSPVERYPDRIITSECPNFYIGRTSGDDTYDGNRRILVDEFNFWSTFKTSQQIREHGAFYKYNFDMEQIYQNQLRAPNIKADVIGRPLVSQGKVDHALVLNGRSQYIDAGDFSASCLGDLRLCDYGVTFSTWLRLDTLRDGQYVYDTGPHGISLSVVDGMLVATSRQGDQQWMAKWDGPTLGKWHYVELTWHPIDRKENKWQADYKDGGGLELWVDFQRVAHTRDSIDRVIDTSAGLSRLMIGRANADIGRTSFAEVALDEMEIVYGDRDRLQRFYVIQRGPAPPENYLINMDTVIDYNLLHPQFDIVLHGNPVNQQGKIRGALELTGENQYADIGDMSGMCLGNIDLCNHGFLTAFWIKPGDLQNGMDILSTGYNGVEMWYDNNRLHATASTSTRTWQLDTPYFHPNTWQYLEVSWHPDTGLKLYIDNTLVAAGYTSQVRTVRSDQNSPERFYVGRGRTPGRRTGNFTIDELEHWRGDRAYLLAHDFIQRGAPTRYLIRMDDIQNGRVQHDTLLLPTSGDPHIVPGIINGALNLDGNNQYLDIGDHGDSCYGDLNKCNHGITGSMWAKFSEFDRNNMYYMSNGGGVRVYYRNGRLYFTLQTPGKEWEVPIPYNVVDKWEFIEYTWHPQKGLQVFINNKKVGETVSPRTIAVQPRDPNNRHFIGRANDKEVPNGYYNYGDFEIDQYETWLSHRDNLIAHEYILRDEITHYMIPLEEADGTNVLHPTLKNIQLVNEAFLTPAKIGNGADFGGSGEYLTLGEFPKECLGDLEDCLHGIYISFFLYPRRLLDNSYFLSAKPYSVYYKDGKTVAEFSTDSDTWTVSTDRVKPNRWNELALSWDPENGLQMFVDDTKVAESNRKEPRSGTPRQDDNVYLGRPHNVNGRYADAMVDEVEVWYASKNNLIAAGKLPDTDIHNIILPMDRIRDNRVLHEFLQVYTHGNPTITTGAINGAVYLDGQSQYLDVGRAIICGGDLKNCPRGLTFRYKLNPKLLRNNTYFVSGGPVNIYYRNGRLHTEVRTPTKQWTTSVSGANIPTNKWTQLDLSWHQSEGLNLYVNDKKMNGTYLPESYDLDYDPQATLYIGRTNTSMVAERYPDAAFDDVQIWEAKRGLLVDGGLIQEGSIPVITARPEASTPRPIPTTPTTYDNKTLVYDGTYWVTYDLAQKKDWFIGEGDYEQFHVRFKTDEPTGQLWHTGDDEKYIHMGLKNGVLVLTVDHDNGLLVDKFRVTPGLPLHDNQWHDVTVTKLGRTVTITIDGRENRQVLSQDFTILRPGDVHLGGGTKPYTDNEPFVGGIKQADIESDGLRQERVNLVDKYFLDPRPTYIYINTGEEDSKPSTEAPGDSGVTFISPRAYLRLPKWDFAESGSLKLQFRTRENEGLMLYNGGQPGKSDFVAVEMYDGIVYFLIDLGDGVHRFPFTDRRMDDGEPHKLAVDRFTNYLKLTLDNQTTEHQIPSRESSLDLGTFLYVGGYDNPTRLPWHLWTRKLKYFVGCLFGLQVNSEPHDLGLYLRDQRMDSVVPECTPSLAECAAGPCVHGTCHESYQGYHCDCSNTQYTGKNCDIDAPIILFNGNDDAVVRISVQPTMVSHTDDISLRFKTLKEDGLLFKTNNRITDDTLQMSIEDGQGVLYTNLGGQQKRLYFCDNLNDNIWHTVYIQRRANHMEAWVDKCSNVTVDLPTYGYTLDVDEIWVAAEGLDFPPDQTFLGNMQNFYYNEKKFFEYLDDTKKQNTTQEVAINKVTYRENTNSYVSMSPLGSSSNLDINLMFKTDQGNGILLFNEGRGGDYFTVYLSNGYLFFVARGTEGERVTKISKRRFNDNVWHQLKIRPNSGGANPMNFLLSIDQEEFVLDISKIDSSLDLSRPLYIGGLEEDMYRTLPPTVVTKQSYAGCLATLIVQGKLQDLYRDGNHKTEFVSEGCTDWHAYCQGNVCQNYGQCVELISGYHCDCNMTSFVGDICNKEAEGYRFGKRHNAEGIMTYEFTPPVGTSKDELAFGFMTWHPNGTLVRIDSGMSTDFIQAKLVNGHVIIEYDIGNGLETITANQRVFNNGEYHYVRFIREGKDVRMTIDDYPLVTRISQGNAVLFNELAIIKVGGNQDVSNNIIDHFNGIISGLYFNGERFIDMGVIDQSAKIMTQGDVQTAGHYFYLSRPVIVPTKDPGTGVIVVPPTADPGGPDGGIVTKQPVTSRPKYQPIEVPADHGGGGIAWAGVAPSGQVIPPGGGVYRHTGGGGGGWTGGGGGSAGGGSTGGGGGSAGGGGGSTGGGGGSTGGGGGGSTGGGSTGGGGGGSTGGGSAGGGGDGPAGIIVAVDPGGGGGGVNDVGLAPGAVVVPGAGGPPLAAAAVSGGAGVGAGDVSGVRAAGVAGAFLAVLAAASSVMWAVYKFKPGLISLGGGGGGGGGAMNISPPAASYPLLKAQGGAGGGGGGGGGYGAGAIEMNGFPPGGGFAAASSRGAGTQTMLLGANMNMAEFSSSSGATMSGVAGVVAMGSGAVSRGTQTSLSGMGYSSIGNGGYSSSRYVANDSSMVTGYNQFASNAAATSTMVNSSNVSSSAFRRNSYYQRTAEGDVYSAGGVVSVARQPQPMATEMGTQTVMNAVTQTDFEEPDGLLATIHYNTIAAPPSHAQVPPNYDVMGFTNSSYLQQQQQASNRSAGYSGLAGNNYATIAGGGYSDNMQQQQQLQPQQQQAQNQSASSFYKESYSSMSSSANYHAMMQNQHMAATNLFGAQSAQHQAAGIMMTSEEIRVDCVMLTKDGRYVVTGSIYGPPQIWDMKTGNLVRLLEGTDMSSTDLHLACNDSLLVGQVAEMTQVDPKNPNAKSVHHRKLQIWDFDTGSPLEMGHNEVCTASAMMADGARVVLGRTEKYGNGTTIVIWDLLGNQLLRKIHYDGSIGFADYISYLNLSRDNRYVIAGFQNSFDGKANFLLFDLTVDDYTTTDPKIISLDAVAECSAILDNHEVVTGTRAGQLTIWSARTGKALRQLVSPGPLPVGGASSLARTTARSAHSREVNAVEISHDGKMLVSVSSDHSVKIWNLENERLMFTLKGHTDEVLCCTISNDDEIVVTGGRDGSIRLWRLQTGQHVCSFNTGVDVFTVKMSSDRRTVVALGDKEGARKLIMLRVVVTKVRSRAGSRATSPQTDDHSIDSYHHSLY